MYQLAKIKITWGMHVTVMLQKILLNIILLCNKCETQLGAGQFVTRLMCSCERTQWRKFNHIVEVWAIDRRERNDPCTYRDLINNLLSFVYSPHFKYIQCTFLSLQCFLLGNSAKWLTSLGISFFPPFLFFLPCTAFVFSSYRVHWVKQQ